MPGREVDGEPARYSARIVRTVEEGDRREVIEGRVARDGDMLRQEWSEQGELRVSITRGDTGKCYELSPSSRTYSEVDLLAETDVSNTSPLDPVDTRAGGKPADIEITPESIEASFAGTPAPEKSESRTLPDETINGYRCSVVERTDTWPDGHSEITRTYRAPDLSGLAIRTELQSNAGGLKRLVTELLDLTTDVHAIEFEVPEGFRKVDSIRGR